MFTFHVYICKNFYILMIYIYRKHTTKQLINCYISTV